MFENFSQNQIKFAYINILDKKKYLSVKEILRIIQKKIKIKNIKIIFTKKLKGEF